MQIHLGNRTTDKRRVDFCGNTKEGVSIELVDKTGLTYFSKRITETERLILIETLTRQDNGKSV